MNNQMPEGMEFDQQLMVLDFHKATGLTVGMGPQIQDQELRARLILEEAVEFANAVGLTPTVDEKGTITLTPNGREPDLVEAADALCDELYVTYGAAVTFGLYLPQLFYEVHRSNMTKAGTRILTREDGKIEKPETFEPPQLEPIIEAQRQAFEDVMKVREQLLGMLGKPAA